MRHLISATLLLSLPALAQIRPAERPNLPATAHFEPIEENPYFSQDENDPRVLHAKPGALLDRGYIEHMARPPLPNRVWTTLAESGAERSAQPMPHPSDVPVLTGGATVINGNIIVIEGNSNLAVQTNQGLSFNHQGGGLQEAIQQTWTRAGDNFDFITVFTTFLDQGVAAYYLPLQNDITGLGNCNFNAGDTFGCVFSQLGPGTKLQGFVFMNSLDFWQFWDQQADGFTHPLDDFDANVYAVLGQEVAHRWGSGLRFVDPRTGAVSTKLLGRDNSHWASYVDTDASVMDGMDWEVEGDHFNLVDDMKRYSTLDLYAMGAQPVGSAKPFFFIDNATFIPVAGLQLPNAVPAALQSQIPYSVERLDNEFGIQLSARGERVDLNVQDIVDAEGLRCPDPDHTQKAFRQAFVLVTRPGETAAQVASTVTQLETVMATWEDWWSLQTDNALTLCTDLVGDCLHAEVGLGTGTVNDGKLVDPGSQFDVEIEITASGNAVRNAVVDVQLFGSGADDAELEETQFSVGDIPAGETRKILVPIKLSDEYACGKTFGVEAKVHADNASPSSERYRVFPGYKEIWSFTFDEGTDDFALNDDGKDNVQSGAMEYMDTVALSCEMTPRTPERDATPGGSGAFVTGAAAELDGTTSLWTGKIPLKGATAPEVRFNYWLDVGEGHEGKLVVYASEDGEKFKEAKVYDEPFHGWVLGRVDMRETFDTVPEDVHLIFEFTGNGEVEGAIDDVTVLDRDGQCKVVPGCTCTASGDTSRRAASGGFALLLLAFFFRKRR